MTTRDPKSETRLYYANGILNERCRSKPNKRMDRYFANAHHVPSFRRALVEAFKDDEEDDEKSAVLLAVAALFRRMDGAAKRRLLIPARVLSSVAISLIALVPGLPMRNVPRKPVARFSEYADDIIQRILDAADQLTAASRPPPPASVSSTMGYTVASGAEDAHAYGSDDDDVSDDDDDVSDEVKIADLKHVVEVQRGAIADSERNTTEVRSQLQLLKENHAHLESDLRAKISELATTTRERDEMSRRLAGVPATAATSAALQAELASKSAVIQDRTSKLAEAARHIVQLESDLVSVNAIALNNYKAAARWTTAASTPAKLLSDPLATNTHKLHVAQPVTLAELTSTHAAYIAALSGMLESQPRPSLNPQRYAVVKALIEQEKRISLDRILLAASSTPPPPPPPHAQTSSNHVILTLIALVLTVV